jgi:7-cyano-7-deazaguanine reductase
VQIECPEFTSICPVTGAPDFGEITICYHPDKHLVETKSLKLFMWSFREERLFNEQIVELILEEIWSQLKPLFLQVVGRFNSRGGLSLSYTAARHRSTAMSGVGEKA